nr:hypothetical protein GCM10020092_069190 [Actinoplanes digitatis]
MPDLGDAGEAALELLDRRGVLAVHGDRDQHLEPEAERGRIDDRPVAPDGAGALQLAQPPMDRRRAEPDPLGQLGDGELAVRLQERNNIAVNGVHAPDSSPGH